MVIHSFSQHQQGRPQVPLDCEADQVTEEVVVYSDTPRILIVDDDPMVLGMVSKMMQRIGYQTTTAMDGLMALNFLKKGPYDLVITDYNMPFIDGYELADQIKETHFGTKVIVMTGNCDEDVLDMLKASNIIDGFLLKPFNIKMIKKKIEKVLCR